METDPGKILIDTHTHTHIQTNRHTHILTHTHTTTNRQADTH